MTTENTYEGWVNWTTWNLALWIDNDYGMHKSRLRSLGENPTADECEAFARSLLGDKTPDGAELDAVNWTEVAEHWTGE